MTRRIRIQTPWRPAFAPAIALGCLLALAGLLLRGEGLARSGALLLMAIAALMQGLLGHGAATDLWTTTALGLHVLAAGLWLGALAPLLAVCRMLPAQAPLLARRFHDDVRARLPGLEALPEPLPAEPLTLF